ncbi:MAG TPA: trypsin-like serine protease [Candidatus Limnocylindria bacterium]|jgi:hypothetical protein|nr:trypsin-like serine protease [Candidatus Limnocylindria bacterium]
MRKLFFAVLAALMLASAIPVAAITYGEADNGRHPYVGLVVFYDASNTPQWRCSGTLLSSTVLLTAGHCTGGPDEGIVAAQVWFSDFEPFGTWSGSGPCGSATGYPCAGGVRGTPHTHPQFAFTLPNTHDVGIVTLESGVRSKTYGKLPALGFLDDLATRRGQQDITLTAVGFGLKEIKPAFNSDRTRWLASQQIKDLRSALTDGYNIGTTNDPGNGTSDGTTESGGTCFGDSGGPVFYGDATSNLVVGITSFGLNSNCKGGDYAYRTDINDAQSFIRQFVK